MISRPFVLALAFLLSVIIPIGYADRSTAQDPKQKTDAAKPPPGWKEHSPADGTYVVWVPEKANRQSERSSTRSTKGVQMKFNTLTILINGGPTYIVEEALLSPNLAKKLSHSDLEDLFRDETASIVGGKVTDETEVKSGNISGKEYRIEGKTNARSRVFVTPTNSRVFLLRVTGTKDQVDGDNAKVFLESGRLTAAKNAAGPRGPRIQGGGNDPEFKSEAPEGGLLVGLEVCYGMLFDNTTVRTVRPVFRVGDKDTTGTQFGTPDGDVVKAVAKPGYAVGMLTVKAGQTVEGFSITFMKVKADGKLDPKDSYESDWMGGKGGTNPVKIGGDGTPVIGLIGKANATSKDVTGIGLIYKESDKPAEKK